MIIKEIIEINGNRYDHTYSDLGKRIVRDGVTYETAIDPLNSGRVYAECEENAELTADEALSIILGGEA
jgi:hypothetical protein